MKNAYIFHGCAGEDEYFSDDFPSPSNFHWLPWLQKQLLMRGYRCQTPEMPTPYKPDYSEWKSVLDHYPVNAETSLVAHSCGSGFLLRWLSENKRAIQRLVMVAPSLDLQRKRGEFSDFTLASDLLDRIGEMHVFYSSDETVAGIKESVDLILQAYPKARLHSFNNMGHFCLAQMGTDKFPELLSLFPPLNKPLLRPSP